jgi:hypothetical protein
VLPLTLTLSVKNGERGVNAGARSSPRPELVEGYGEMPPIDFAQEAGEGGSAEPKML